MLTIDEQITEKTVLEYISSEDQLVNFSWYIVGCLLDLFT